ncbi:MAG: glycosyltransferase, partial [Chloroflexota bacterium]
MKIGYLLQEGVPNIRKKPFSGPANHVVYVIQELKKAGHQVSLLAKLDNKIYISDDLENFRPVEVRFLERGLIRLFEKIIRRIQYEFNLPYANFFESLRFAFACRQVLSDCDIYFERMGWLGYGGAIASQLQHIPLIWEINGDHIDEFKIRGITNAKSQQQLSYYLMEKATRKICHAVASGEGWRQKYIDRWRIEPTKITAVQNGSAIVDILQAEDLKNFRPVESVQPIRIVYCGGFEVWHGIPILIHAVRHAIDSGCDLHVTLIGSGSERNNTVDLI